MRENNKLFFSYSTQDSKSVSSLAENLERAGFSVWMDRTSIKGRESWKSAIVEGIRQASAILVCLTPNAINSEWVRKELFIAQISQKKSSFQLCSNLVLNTWKHSMKHEN